MKKTLKTYKCKIYLTIQVNFSDIKKNCMLLLCMLLCQLCKPFTYTVINFIGTTQLIFQPTGASLKNGT